MYLTDREIHARLDDIDFVAPDDNVAFSPDDQIQPCSVDLRMSRVYWTPKGTHRSIDLARSRLLEVNPRRYWKRHELELGEALTLRPGQLVLARTYERFTVPTDCSAAIEGRSSFARMGLQVHASGGFINPGWRGHMPLTLTNQGSSTLRLPAYLGLCQLMLIPLTGAPDRTYGHSDLLSKYMDDDGGPSYWWRDKMLTKLLAELGAADINIDMQERLLDRIGLPPDEVLERFERFVSEAPANTHANVDELLTAFAKREDTTRMTDRTVLYSARGAFPLLLSVSLGSLFSHPIGLLHYLVWLVTVLSIPFSIAAYRQEPSQYLGSRELAKIDADTAAADRHAA